MNQSFFGESNCERCGLYKDCITPQMEFTGQGKRKILFVGEAPGKKEDEKGEQFVGRSGQSLRNRLYIYDIDLDVDCWKMNALACRTPNNRDPKDSEIKLCHPSLLMTIEELKPDKIILLGKYAVQSFLANRMSTGPIGKWVGWKIPDQEFKCWIYPLYHPSFIIRNSKSIVLDDLFDRHLEQAVEDDTPFLDYGDETKKIITYTDINSSIDYLDYLYENVRIITIDYETTGLKPYRKGHEIICIGISVNTDSAVAFPIFDDKKFKEKLKKILFNKNIKKIAHNIRFEDVWTRQILGYPIGGWLHDTMLYTHILDNRSRITGLKFQVYVRYGTVGYDKEVEPYLKGQDPKDSNSFNRIKEVDIEKVLQYCGMDAMFTYRLYEDHICGMPQYEKINSKI